MVSVSRTADSHTRYTIPIGNVLSKDNGGRLAEQVYLEHRVWMSDDFTWGSIYTASVRQLDAKGKVL